MQSTRPALHPERDRAEDGRGPASAHGDAHGHTPQEARAGTPLGGIGGVEADGSAQHANAKQDVR